MYIKSQSEPHTLYYIILQLHISLIPYLFVTFQCPLVMSVMLYANCSNSLFAVVYCWYVVLLVFCIPDSHPHFKPRKPVNPPLSMSPPAEPAPQFDNCYVKTKCTVASAAVLPSHSQHFFFEGFYILLCKFTPFHLSQLSTENPFC